MVYAMARAVVTNGKVSKITVQSTVMPVTLALSMILVVAMVLPLTMPAILAMTIMISRALRSSTLLVDINFRHFWHLWHFNNL